MSCISDFEIISTLGEGSFSSVYKVKRISDGEQYALKKVKLPNLKYKEKVNALNEVRILASISDPNIIGYNHAFYDEPSQCLCIVMEYASGGDILNKISEYKKKNQRIPEATIWSYLIQMTRGLKVLHDIKIIHRDLKSANVFISSDDKVAKLGDLNVSKVTENSMANTQAGTPYYASPEIWAHKPYGPKSDIWSLGCIIYELCTFLPPFRAANMTLLFQKISKGSYDNIPACYSPDLSKVIAMCLTVQPGSRASCEKLLTHPIVMAKMTEEQAMMCNKGLIYNDLIGAIKLPSNLKTLNLVLPKPNYKSREAVSLMDLDAACRVDEDLMAKMTEQRPQTRTDLDGKEPKSIYSPAKIQKESSLERVLKSREVKQSLAPLAKHYSIPSTDPVKKSEKVNSVQKGYKGVLSGINELKKNAPKLPESIFNTNLPAIRSKHSVATKGNLKAIVINVKELKADKNVSENKDNNANKNIFAGEDGQQSVRPIY